MKYIGPDFCNITTLLTDEELLIQKTANEFVAKEFMPLVNEYYEKGSFPVDLIPKMGELGFFGATLPKKYGGSEISSTAYGLIMQELEKGDSGLRSVCSVQGGLVMYPIFQYGTEEQKDKWLPKLASGEAVGCFGLTESNHGSDPGGMATKAALALWDGCCQGCATTEEWLQPEALCRAHSGTRLGTLLFPQFVERIVFVARHCWMISRTFEAIASRSALDLHAVKHRRTHMPVD